jgi:flagellum-specific ATP synthase
MYRDHEDLITIGAYRRGSNPQVDLAIEMREEINRFLTQRREESSTLDSARSALVQLGRQALSRMQTQEKPHG